MSGEREILPALHAGNADPAVLTRAAAPRRRAAAWAPWRFPGPWLLAAVFCLAYALADPATNLFPHPRFGVQPWSARPALAVALVAFFGPRYAPAILFAALAGWWLAPGGSLDFESIAAALALTLIFGCAGMALGRWARWSDAQVGPRDVHVFLAVALVAAILGALVDASRQYATSAMASASLPQLSFRWFIANLLGLVVLAPALLQWAGRAARPGQGVRWPRATVLRDAALFVAVLAAMLYIDFGVRPLDEFRMSYVLFLPMIVVAMRYGVLGVATSVPVLQLALLGALATAGTRAGTAFEYQLLLLTLAVAALYLGALSDERQRAAESIGAHERALRERSQALADAQRIASTAELAAALAHDLSQPLSAVGTYARACQVLAARGPEDRARLADALDQIAQEVGRAGQYLRRMREFFRTGAMRAERVDVAELFDATYAHMRDRLVRADIRWHATLESGLPAVRADAVQTGALLGNLVANACDALSEHAAIRRVHAKAFRVRVDGLDMVRIQIEDTGAGLAPEIRDRLFTPLATSKPAGMGLGLALSRSIAERQGGRLWFDPSREYTTFCLDLPVHE